MRFGSRYTVSGVSSNSTISGSLSNNIVTNVENVHFASGNTVAASELWSSALSVAIANQLFVSYMGRAGDVQWRASTAVALHGGQPSVALQKEFYSHAVSEGVFNLHDISLALVNKVFYQIFNFGASDWEQRAWVNLVDSGIIAKEQLPWGMFVGYLGSTTVPDAYRVPCQCKLLAVDAYTNELLNNSVANDALMSTPTALTYARNYVAEINNIPTAAAAISNVSKSVAILSNINVNEAPSVTSGGTASFRENATGTVYTATGTDINAGTTLTYVLGGTLVSLFDVNAATGAVTFKASPNFEAPGDAGANNVYDITVAASDGVLSSVAKAVAITVTNVDEVILGTQGPDTVTATSQNDTLQGLGGDDRLAPRRMRRWQRPGPQPLPAAMRVQPTSALQVTQ